MLYGKCVIWMMKLLPILVERVPLLPNKHLVLLNEMLAIKPPLENVNISI